MDKAWRQQWMLRTASSEEANCAACAQAAYDLDRPVYLAYCDEEATKAEISKEGIFIDDEAFDEGIVGAQTSSISFIGAAITITIIDFCVLVAGAFAFHKKKNGFTLMLMTFIMTLPIYPLMFDMHLVEEQTFYEGDSTHSTLHCYTFTVSYFQKATNRSFSSFLFIVSICLFVLFGSIVGAAFNPNCDPACDAEGLILCLPILLIIYCCMQNDEQRKGCIRAMKQITMGTYFMLFLVAMTLCIITLVDMENESLIGMVVCAMVHALVLMLTWYHSRDGDFAPRYTIEDRLVNDDFQDVAPSAPILYIQPEGVSFANERQPGEISPEIIFHEGDTAILKFNPGPLGITRSRKKRKVIRTVLPGGQVDQLNVQPGWKIVKLNEDPFKEELFQELIKGNAPYNITFKIPN